ncbi:hypothetical protein UPYG_G00274880 [Umbra pygmaea]|uniref:Uncharacterized protein n=1 Tax=Umbra pygmaea TaxID=75934 RepID=A0ABD0WJV6_UMBPY
MKAISAKRSVKNNISNSSEHSLGISRSKSPMNDPISLLYNMNDCYKMLKELVPNHFGLRLNPLQLPASTSAVRTKGNNQESPSNHQLRHQSSLLSIK